MKGGPTRGYIIFFKEVLGCKALEFVKHATNVTCHTTVEPRYNVHASIFDQLKMLSTRQNKNVMKPTYWDESKDLWDRELLKAHWMKSEKQALHENRLMERLGVLVQNLTLSLTFLSPIDSVHFSGTSRIFLEALAAQRKFALLQLKEEAEHKQHTVQRKRQEAEAHVMNDLCHDDDASNEAVGSHPAVGLENTALAAMPLHEAKVFAAMVPGTTMDELANLFGDGQEKIMSWAKSACVLDGEYVTWSQWPTVALQCLQDHAVHLEPEDQMEIIRQLKVQISDHVVTMAVIKANQLAGFRDWRKQQELTSVLTAILRHVREQAKSMALLGRQGFAMASAGVDGQTGGQTDAPEVTVQKRNGNGDCSIETQAAGAVLAMRDAGPPLSSGRDSRISSGIGRGSGSQTDVEEKPGPIISESGDDRTRFREQEVSLPDSYFRVRPRNIFRWNMFGKLFYNFIFVNFLSFAYTG
jgi:hypothetical protein